MTNGIPKPPPGFQLVEPGRPPAPPRGFRMVPPDYAGIPAPMGAESLREQPSTARNIARSVAEGATFGFSDEAQAAIAALMDQGMTYGEALTLIRERMARIPTGQRVAGNIVGGIATAPMIGLRAPGTVAQAARQGGGLGALAGAGFAEGGPTERLAGAGVGAALGAPLAAGGQALIGAVGRAIARARQGVTGQTARAMDRVLQEMQAGEITPQQAIKRVERLGPEGMLADVPELQRLAQQTAARTTTGQRIGQSALEARRAGAGQRVNQALDLALGGRNTREVRNAIVMSRKAEADELYKAALEGDPLQLTDDLAKLIGTSAKKSSRFNVPWGNDPRRPQLQILVNPTAKEAERLASRVPSGELRMLRDPETLDVLFWDAGRATHDQIAGQVLGKTMAEVQSVPQSVGQVLRKSVILNHPVFDTFRGTRGSSIVRREMERIRRSNPRFMDAPDTDRDLLHAVRVSLADQGKLGTTPGQRNVIDVTKQLTDAMDDAGATGYRQAVNQYRTDSLTLEAFDKGRKALNALPEDIAAFMKAAPPAEQDAFIAGLGREILRNIETGETRAATTGVRNIFRGERAQVLKEALGPEEYNTLRNRLLREIRFAGTEQAVLRGSPTEPRQAALAEQMRRLGRVERAGEAIRSGRGIMGAGAELVASAQPTAPSVARERALAQLLFRSQGQGLPSARFAERTPLLELAMRQRLLQGTDVPVARAAVPGAAGVGGGRGGNALLNLVGF